MEGVMQDCGEGGSHQFSYTDVNPVNHNKSQQDKINLWTQ